jgi:hypothetical protein
VPATACSDSWGSLRLDARRRCVRCVCFPVPASARQYRVPKVGRPRCLHFVFEVRVRSPSTRPPPPPPLPPPAARRPPPPRAPTPTWCLFGWSVRGRLYPWCSCFAPSGPSGDSGVGGGAGCKQFVPTFPSASPWVTAVGGTNYLVSAVGFTSHVVHVSLPQPPPPSLTSNIILPHLRCEV